MRFEGISSMKCALYFHNLPSEDVEDLKVRVTLTLTPLVSSDVVAFWGERVRTPRSTNVALRRFAVRLFITAGKRLVSPSWTARFTDFIYRQIS